MRFLIAMVKDGNPIVKIDFGGTIGEKWATTTQAVVNFTKNNLQGHAKDNSYSGDEVTVEYTVNNGKYNVTKIVKVGATTSPVTNNTPVGTVKPTCSDCGIEVKDAKYKKCYTCNQKNPTPKTSNSKNGNFRTPEQITKDEIGHMTARTMVGLAGVIDPNNVTAIIRNVYQTYKDLVR